MISRTKVHSIVLLAGLLLYEGVVPALTVQFLIKSYADLSELGNSRKGVTAKRMGENYNCSPQAAIKHIKKLEDQGVLVRSPQSGWAFNWDYAKRLNELLT